MKTRSNEHIYNMLRWFTHVHTLVTKRFNSIDTDYRKKETLQSMLSTYPSPKILVKL